MGEVITSEEAESRGKKYDADGRTYLFDLDFNLGDENIYTVSRVQCLWNLIFIWLSNDFAYGSATLVERDQTIKESRKKKALHS